MMLDWGSCKSSLLLLLVLHCELPDLATSSPKMSQEQGQGRMSQGRPKMRQERTQISQERPKIEPRDAYDGAEKGFR